MRNRSTLKHRLVVGLVLFLIAVAANLHFGASNFGLWDIVEPHEGAARAADVIFAIRLPRTIVAAASGAALALAGVLSQGIFRNTLASPSIIGTTAGACFAAAVAYWLGAAHAHWSLVPGAAFAGALAATLLVVFLSRRYTNWNSETLLLMGFALNTLFGAGTSLVIASLYNDQQRSAALGYWLLGGFVGAGWEHVAIIVPVLVIGFLAALRLGRRLDILMLGEEVAASLAIDRVRLRQAVIVALAFLAGGAVSVGGNIAFIGLIVPHATRMMFGARHRLLIPMSALNGMTMLLGADLLARTVLAPQELQVGVLTAILGGAFFLILLAQQARKEGRV